MLELLSAPDVKPCVMAADYQRRLREGRLLAGASLSVVAAAVGLSPQAISQCERGRQRLDVEKLVAVCEALGLNVRWVLTGRGGVWEGPAPTPRKPRAARRVVLV